MIIPQTHDQHHSAFHGLPHLGQAAHLVVVVVVAEEVFRVATELIGDGVVLVQAVEACLCQ